MSGDSPQECCPSSSLLIYCLYLEVSLSILFSHCCYHYYYYYCYCYCNCYCYYRYCYYCHCYYHCRCYYYYYYCYYYYYHCCCYCACESVSAVLSSWFCSLWKFPSTRASLSFSHWELHVSQWTMLSLHHHH